MSKAKAKKTRRTKLRPKPAQAPATRPKPAPLPDPAPEAHAVKAEPPKERKPGEYVPRAMVNSSRRICLEVLRSSGGVQFILHEAGELHVQKERAAFFDAEWTRELIPQMTESFTPKLLAARMLVFGETVGMTGEARAHLTHIAETGEAMREPPPPESPPKPLPEALKAHQFQRVKTDDMRVKLAGKPGGKLQKDSLREQVVEWLRTCDGKSATIEALNTQFNRDMRGVISKLQEKGWLQ